MKMQLRTSQYYLTKDRKLEIHENNQIFKSKVPLRFHLGPLVYFRNIFLNLIRSKKRLKIYSLQDLKDQSRKKIYLTHSEILQVWNHPIKDAKKTTTKLNKKG